MYIPILETCAPKLGNWRGIAGKEAIMVRRWQRQGLLNSCCCCCSFTESSPTVRLRGLQHTRLPCPSLSPRLCLDVCPSSQWCYLTTSSSATPFSVCLQSFPASRSFPISRLFPSGGQSIGASASESVLPMCIQGWFSLGLTGLIPLQSKGLSRVFSGTIIRKHQFFSPQPSLWSNSHIRTWLLEKSQRWL